MDPKCSTCKQTVYIVEKFEILGKIYHRWCFRCTICGTTLTLKNYSSIDGVPYCFAHSPEANKRKDPVKRHLERRASTIVDYEQKSVDNQSTPVAVKSETSQQANTPQESAQPSPPTSPQASPQPSPPTSPQETRSVQRKNFEFRGSIIDLLRDDVFENQSNEQRKEEVPHVQESRVEHKEQTPKEPPAVQTPIAQEIPVQEEEEEEREEVPPPPPFEQPPSRSEPEKVEQQNEPQEPAPEPQQTENEQPQEPIKELGQEQGRELPPQESQEEVPPPLPPIPTSDDVKEQDNDLPPPPPPSFDNPPEEEDDEHQDIEPDSSVVHWFFETLNRVEAEKILQLCTADAFLVRNSSVGPNCFALSMIKRNLNKMNHSLILHTEEGFFIKDCPTDRNIYTSILELVTNSPFVRGFSPAGRGNIATARPY